MRRLKERGGSLAESPAVDVLAVLVGLSLGTPTTWRRKWLASRIEYAITREPIGARVVSPDFTTAGQRWDDRTTG
ncbi:hypothetical protein GCM10025867_18260 [Frondihabitans sucicola]|uniref:Uncharacterized protein n=1 Tax=Frondihabitans sucicola TaxID=1268041 RepID=A0ABM8GMD8_9MICO|nr:hypothetical protein [Frondihabitans sucicola]BDZ49585.1 hypothetical protein GCM10025867_18260 [Frondihabitans sucicola]